MDEAPGGDHFAERSFRGPIHRVARQALDYIQRNYVSETVIKHQDRAEATRVENFPYAAIKAAVVNFLHDRGSEEHEPVEIRIGMEDLVVLSYPWPDRAAPLEDFRAGRTNSRRYRNRRIGQFLKELELAEGRSTAIRKIIHAMAQNGSPPPEFDFDADHQIFSVRLPVHPLARPPVAIRLPIKIPIK